MRIMLVAGLAAAISMAAFRRAEALAPQSEMKSAFAEVNGIKLHYMESGKGKIILFLHGFPEFWYAWKNQVGEFGKDMRAVAVDMRGYNLSDKPEKVDDYSISKLVEDVRALIDKLDKGKKVVLVGHDWGGAIAWVFAAMHPDYVDKLVIVNGPHPGIFARELANNPDQQKASGYMNLFKSPQAEGALSANNYGALVNAVINGSKPGSFTEEDKKEYLKAWAQPGAITGGLNYYRAAKLGPPAAGAKAEDLPKLPSLDVKVPTLVIWGEKDTALLVGNLDGLDKFVPNLTIKRIPNGSHWVVHEEPETINKMIRDFVSK